jgi:hypothetical protein
LSSQFRNVRFSKLKNDEIMGSDLRIDLSQDARTRANAGIYFGEEKGIKTEVGEVHEISRKNSDNVNKHVCPQGFQIDFLALKFSETGL